MVKKQTSEVPEENETPEVPEKNEMKLIKVESDRLPVSLVYPVADSDTLKLMNNKDFFILKEITDELNFKGEISQDREHLAFMIVAKLLPPVELAKWEALSIEDYYIAVDIVTEIMGVQESAEDEEVIKKAIKGNTNGK